MTTIEEFITAATKKDVVTIKKGIRNGININCEEKDGDTALHRACGVKNNDEVVSVLLAAKADVNSKNRYGQTALHKAAVYNAGLSVVVALVQAGADVNAVDGGNCTALHRLSDCEDSYWPGDDGVNNKERIAMAEYLLMHGAQPSLTIKTANIENPAERATGLKRLKLAAYLRDWKPSPTEESKQDPKQEQMKMTTVEEFIAAAKTMDIVTLQRGIQNGLNVNQTNNSGDTTLLVACHEKENDEVVAVLLAAKADVNFKNKHGITALHRAAMDNAGLSVVIALVQAGADVNAVDKNKWTALHMLSIRDDSYWWPGDDGVNKERIAMAEYLLAHGAQPSLTIKDRDDENPDEMATSLKRVKLAAYLRDQTKSLPKQEQRDMTTIDTFLIAAMGKDIVAVKKGLQNGFSIGQTNDDGEAALHAACCGKENDEMVEVLLAAKADVNLKTFDGLTALHCAASFNAGLSVVITLVQAGADVNAFTNDKLTVLHFLSNCDDSEWPGDDGVNKERIAMAEYLLTHGAQPSLTVKNKSRNRNPAENAARLKRFFLAAYLRDWKPAPTKSAEQRLADESALRVQVDQKQDVANNALQQQMGESDFHKTAADARKTEIDTLTADKKQMETELATYKAALQDSMKALGRHKVDFDSLLAQNKQMELLLEQKLAAANQALQQQIAERCAHKATAEARKAEVDILTSQKQQAEQRALRLERELVAANDSLQQQKAAAEAQKTEAITLTTEKKQVEAELATCKAALQELESKTNARFNASDLLGEGQGGRVFRVRYNGADIAAKYIKTEENDEIVFTFKKLNCNPTSTPFQVMTESS